MANESMFNLKAYLSDKRAAVDGALAAWFPRAEGPVSDLISAMRYSLFAGGKRLRPILCIAGCEAVGGSQEDVIHVACSLELIHTYSLIHDDLPVMDNDDFRRGKPTNHKVFGDAMALLAGDGLLTEAFRMMTSNEISQRVSPAVLVQAVRLISLAAGYEGMVGGQVVDIQSEGKKPDLETVKYMHARKTGALITASVTAGAILGEAGEDAIGRIRSYGQKAGLAFQIADDILDIEGDSEILGKQTGADENKGKMTYPAVLGIDESKKIQSDLIQGAIRDLSDFGNKAEPLRQIARYIIERKK